MNMEIILSVYSNIPDYIGIMSVSISGLRFQQPVYVGWFCR